MQELPFTARVRRQGTAHIITIPSEVAKITNLEEGDFVISKIIDKIKCEGRDFSPLCAEV